MKLSILQNVNKNFIAASSTFSDSSHLLVSGNGSSYLCFDKFTDKIEYFEDDSSSKFINSSSRICSLGNIQLLVEFTGLIWKIENKVKSKLIQLEHEVFDICKIYFQDRYYLIAVACDGCVSIVDLENADKNDDSEKLEVYLFDLGMNIRSSGCGTFYRFNKMYNEFEDQNILVLVTFQGKYLVFDLEQLLIDKLKLKNELF